MRDPIWDGTDQDLCIVSGPRLVLNSDAFGQEEFGAGRIKICALYLAVLGNNCKSARQRAVLLQVTCLFLCLQAAWRPRGPRLVLNAGAFGQEEFGASS